MWDNRQSDEMIKDLQWRTKLLIAFVLFTIEG